MKIYTFDPKKSKKVLSGEVKDNVFTRKVTSKHFMNLIQGYGIQEDVMGQLKELGVREIILETPTENLRCSIEVWLGEKIKVMDFGHGRQRFLPVRYMKPKKEKEEKLFHKDACPNCKVSVMVESPTVFPSFRQRKCFSCGYKKTVRGDEIFVLEKGRKQKEKK